MSNPVLVEASLGPQGLTTELRARQHRWSGDEPVAAGGADSAPTPYELLLGSLGACTAMTLRLYVRRKGWDLETIGVALTLDAEAKRIARRLTLRGRLDAIQRARLVEIANACPVHRLLEGGLAIETELEEA